jgi:hypothetical protein
VTGSQSIYLGKLRETPTSIVKMEAVCSSETSVPAYHTSLCHKAEYHIMNLHLPWKPQIPQMKTFSKVRLTLPYLVSYVSADNQIGDFPQKKANCHTTKFDSENNSGVAVALARLLYSFLVKTKLLR